jgi:hypothetical protein
VVAVVVQTEREAAMRLQVLVEVPAVLDRHHLSLVHL